MSVATSNYIITVPERESAPERTGWRDQWISEWHRRQHHSLAMVDLDFVCTEMAYTNPVAIIDYKRMRPMKLGPSAALKGINNLANMADLPFFIVFYQQEPPVFTIEPKNPRAHKELPYGAEVMSEREYVEWLFALRREIPDEVCLRELSTEKPW